MTDVPEAVTTVSKNDTGRKSSGLSPVFTGVAVMLVLFGIAGFAANSLYTNTAGVARTNFEKVLNTPTSELESKSASELNDYRKDVERGAHFSPLIGNVTGYDSAVVDRELKRINDLILQKTAH